jgi:ABC-type enterobactin transport system permease subunit
METEFFRDAVKFWFFKEVVIPFIVIGLILGGCYIAVLLDRPKKRK